MAGRRSKIVAGVVAASTLKALIPVPNRQQHVTEENSDLQNKRK